MSFLQADTHEEFWDSVWGEKYPSDEFAGELRRLQEQGELGSLVVDVGAGHEPVTRFCSRSLCKFIETDIASEGTSDLEKTLRLRFNIQELGDKIESTRTALNAAVGFLDLPDHYCEKAGTLQLVDTFVLSYILRYIDFRQVLNSLKKFLKVGGAFIIYDNCMIGKDVSRLNGQSFNDQKGIQSYFELMEFLTASKNYNIRSGTFGGPANFILMATYKGLVS